MRNFFTQIAGTVSLLWKPIWNLDLGFENSFRKKIVHLKIYQQEISLEKVYKITSSFQDLRR